MSLVSSEDKQEEHIIRLKRRDVLLLRKLVTEGLRKDELPPYQPLQMHGTFFSIPLHFLPFILLLLVVVLWATGLRIYLFAALPGLAFCVYTGYFAYQELSKPLIKDKDDGGSIASEFFQRLGSADDFSRLPSQYSYRITRTTSWDRFSAVPSAGMQAILEGLDEEDLERSQSTSSVTTATSMNYKDYVKTMREFKKREREKLRQARAEQEAKEREMEEGAATSSANEVR